MSSQKATIIRLKHHPVEHISLPPLKDIDNYSIVRGKRYLLISNDFREIMDSLNIDETISIVDHDNNKFILRKTAIGKVEIEMLIKTKK